MTTIPTTPEQADAWFRCDRLRGSMSGSACAARWSQATVARRYGHGSMGIEGYDCKGCQLGAARHRLGAHERPPQFQMIEPPRAPAASKNDQEDEMPKRHDLTPTARAVLAWATGRDWWRRRDVDEGVESGDHAVACALRDLRGLGLLEMRGVRGLGEIATQAQDDPGALPHHGHGHPAGDGARSGAAGVPDGVSAGAADADRP